MVGTGSFLEASVWGTTAVTQPLSSDAKWLCGTLSFPYWGVSTAGIRVGLEYVFWHMSQLGISSSVPPSGGGHTHSELDGQVVSHLVQEGSCGFLLA